MTRALPWLLSMSVLAGCAAFAGKQDYADYRAIRLAGDEEARLLAMRRYVSVHPDGRWAAEVQAERKQTDMDFFESAKGSRAGLELYVEAFPDGAFIEQAQTRLQAIALIEARKRQEAERAAKLAEQRKQREAELRRTWVTRFVGYWTRTLLSLSGWGHPIGELARGNPDFSRAFGRPPRPRCTTEECVKHYVSNYAVPIPGGTRLERRMKLILRLRMREGRVERAELLLPAWGFSRWREVEERRVVVDADPEDRREAVQWALSHVQPLLAELMPAREPLPDYTLEAIPPPAIGDDGELTDTSVEDPSAPPNRIRQSAGSAPGAPSSSEPSVEEMVEPVGPEPEADMVMAPLTVGKDGRAAGTGDAATEIGPGVVPDEGHGGEVMVMDPLAVGEDGAAAEPDPGAEARPGGQVQLQIVPPQVEAYAQGPLRVVVFAAGSDAAAPAYDGIVIEHVEPAPGKKPGKGRKSQKSPKPPKRAPTAPAP